MGGLISKLCGCCLPTTKPSQNKLCRIPSLIVQRSQLIVELEKEDEYEDEVRTEYSTVLARDFEIKGRRRILSGAKSNLRPSRETVKAVEVNETNDIEIKVFQIIHRESGKPFTLTRLTKSRLDRPSGEALCREIRLLAGRLPHHPLLVNLYWTWQDEEYLYRIDDGGVGDGDEYMGSSEIKKDTHTTTNNISDVIVCPVSLDELRKWSSQLALAVHYIHSYGLLHGNIHPQSLCLTDPKTRDLRLGSFKHLRRLESGRGKLTGVYGDDEGYRAPEGEYFEEADWYAYGKTLAFWRNQKLEYSNCDELNDLVYRLTLQDAEIRLGYGPGAFKSIQSHPFFYNTDWPSLLGLASTSTRNSFTSLTASIDSLKRATSTASHDAYEDWKEFLEFSWDVDGQIGQTLESVYRSRV